MGNNIMLLEGCNLSCPYCFASKYVQGSDKGVITIENFKKALDFILKTDNYIGLIGGEPTLHPKFEEILKIVLDERRLEHATLFTNGVVMKKYVPLLSHEKIHLLVNVNSPKDIGQDRYNKIIEGLDDLIVNHYKKNVSLGINLYSNNMDIDYIVELLQRYNLKSLRVAIVVPPESERKKINVIDYYKSMMPIFMKLTRKLYEIKVVPNLDCTGLPKCVPTPEETEFLKKFWELEKDTGGYCNILDGHSCGAVVDIDTKLNAVRCFGMSNHDVVSISQFNNVKELKDYFNNTVEGIARNIPASPQCLQCSEFLTKRCGGGCLAFRSDKIKKAREMIVNNFKVV